MISQQSVIHIVKSQQSVIYIVMSQQVIISDVTRVCYTVMSQQYVVSNDVTEVCYIYSDAIDTDQWCHNSLKYPLMRETNCFHSFWGLEAPPCGQQAKLHQKHLKLTRSSHWNPLQGPRGFAFFFSYFMHWATYWASVFIPLTHFIINIFCNNIYFSSIFILLYFIFLYLGLEENNPEK